LLDRTHELSEVTSFLAAHSGIIRTAAGVSTDASLLWKSDLPDQAVANLLPDLAVGELWRTTSLRSWQFLVFREPGARVLNEGGELSPPVSSALQELKDWREWVQTNRASAAAWFADIELDFPCTVVTGRRDDAVLAQKHQLAELNDSLVGIRIRTYDWLVEAAAQLEERRTL
jgi:hypothetical protein